MRPEVAFGKSSIYDAVFCRMVLYNTCSRKIPKLKMGSRSSRLPCSVSERLRGKCTVSKQLIRPSANCSGRPRIVSWLTEGMSVTETDSPVVFPVASTCWFLLCRGAVLRRAVRGERSREGTLFSLCGSQVDRPRFIGRQRLIYGHFIFVEGIAGRKGKTRLVSQTMRVRMLFQTTYFLT